MRSGIKRILASIGTIFVIAVVAVFVAFLIMAPTKEEIERDLAIFHQVNQQLGFSYLTPYVNGSEVFLITHVEPNGVMARGGLQKDDEIRMRRVDSLYNELLQNRGGTASIPIRRGSEDLDLKISIPQFEVNEVVSQPNKQMEPTSTPR